jgi:hypothetical protein
MAAALIPLIAGVAPSVIELITALVHKQAPIADATHGPGTGPVKFADVFGSVIGGLTSAANAGQIDKSLPSEDQIKLIVQSVVTSMIRSGMLGQGQAQLPATSAPGGLSGYGITLTSGQIVTISVK